MMENEYPKENNKFKRAFIWLWYNDTFRFLFILMGGHLFLTLPPCLLLADLLGIDLSGDSIHMLALGLFSLMMCLAFLFNDYSNLRRIGLDEYRKPLN